MTQFMKYVSMAIIGTFWLAACNEEEDSAPVPVASAPAVAQFKQSNWQVTEKQGSLDVVIFLSKPAPQSGTLRVELGGSHLSQVTTQPQIQQGALQLPVTKGSSSASFRIETIDNALLDGEKIISMSLVEGSEGFSIGTQKIAQVDIADDEAPVEAAFMLNTGTVRENSTLGSTVVIVFANAAPANSLIVVAPASQNLQAGVHYQTEPALVNGKIVLPIEAGAQQASFKILPADDIHYNGERVLELTIESAEGGVRKGDQLTFDLSITDDELLSKGKSYEIVSGNWRVKRTYEYNESGELAKVLWEQYTPHYQGGTYTYEYLNGRLHKMVENANRENYYVWEGDRIVKEEQYTNGLLTRLIEYGYDQAGNVGEALYTYRQPDGEMKAGLLFVYLYFTDGNIYKKMVYNPQENAEPAWIETHTYENYLPVENPFPMVEILPNVSAQRNLATSYHYEGNGKDLAYQMAYEFDANGLPISRTASWSNGSERAVYEYYE